MELMTVEQAADFLNLEPSQIYTLTRKRGRARLAKPIPVIRICSSLRFSKESLIEWVKSLEEK